MLSELRSPERAKAFERFYERWKDDHLVIDNWFAYQAASPLPSALATVVKLTRHPLFSIKNPNKVRALIGTFAMANPVNFNRPDGKGYEFVADRVLEIDAFNPQVAARLLSAFRSWKALEAERRRLAKKTLQRIAKTKPLSHDASEIVEQDARMRVVRVTDGAIFPLRTAFGLSTRILGSRQSARCDSSRVFRRRIRSGSTAFRYNSVEGQGMTPGTSPRPPGTPSMRWTAAAKGIAWGAGAPARHGCDAAGSKGRSWRGRRPSSIWPASASS